MGAVHLQPCVGDTVIVRVLPNWLAKSMTESSEQLKNWDWGAMLFKNLPPSYYFDSDYYESLDRWDSLDYYECDADTGYARVGLTTWWAQNRPDQVTDMTFSWTGSVLDLPWWGGIEFPLMTATSTNRPRAALAYTSSGSTTDPADDGTHRPAIYFDFEGQVTLNAQSLRVGGAASPAVGAEEFVRFVCNPSAVTP